jgi:hypothetical protein
MKRTFFRIHLLLFIILLMIAALVLAAPVMAQDNGIPDTARYQPEVSTWDVDFEGNTYDIDLWAWTDDPDIRAIQLGFIMTTSTGGGTGHDDSLIVVDTFTFATSVEVTVFQRSALDGDAYPDAIHNDFNGYLVAWVSILGGAVIPSGVPTKLGSVRLKIPDPTQLPESFDITLDSIFQPPAGNFVFALQYGEQYPPQFEPASVHVQNIYGSSDPILQLNPNTFEFTATEGGSNPADQILNITNGGSGTINWTVAGDAPWLTLWPLSGSGDGSVTLSVDIGGYTPGTYTGTIVVSDPNAVNSPKYADVTLNVLHPVTQIQLDPSSMAFSGFTEGPNPAVQSLSITNTGEGSLEWTATPDVGWLSVDPVSGNGDATVSVVVDKTGMSEGSYSGTITVSDPWASNTPQEVAVSLELIGTPPYISVDKNFFFFDKIIGEPDPPAQTLAIGNYGGGTFDWTATKTNDWLVLNSSSGTPPSSIIVSVDFEFLASSTALDTIRIASDQAINSPEMVLVMVAKHSVSGTYPWGDADCSGEIDIDDVVYMIAYIFAGGPPPGDTDNDGEPDCL